MCYSYEYDCDHVPTLADWLYFRLARVRGKFARLRRWWKYSVLKKPRPQPSLKLEAFDALLKEIYPATSVECIARAGYPALDFRDNQ